MSNNTINFMGTNYNAGSYQLTAARNEFKTDLSKSSNSQLSTDWSKLNTDQNSFVTDLKNNNSSAFNAYAQFQADSVTGASTQQKQTDWSAFTSKLTSSQKTELKTVQSDRKTFKSDLGNSDSQTQYDFQALQSSRQQALSQGLQSGNITNPNTSSSSSSSNSGLTNQLVQVLQMLMSLFGGGSQQSSNSYGNNYGNMFGSYASTPNGYNQYTEI